MERTRLHDGPLASCYKITYPKLFYNENNEKKIAILGTSLIIKCFISLPGVVDGGGGGVLAVVGLSEKKKL